MQSINISDQHVIIPANDSTEVRIGRGTPNSKLWVRRDKNWVPTVVSGLGNIKYLQLTNLGDQDMVLCHDTPLGMWMTPHLVPRTPGYVSVGSRRYNEWQTLAFEATVDHKEVPPEEPEGSLVDHPRYTTPTKILRRVKDE